MRDSRTAIFRAAAHEFAERGYEAAGTDRIAARARVNKAMLYYHFGSKGELYAEIVRDMVGAVGARVRAVADGPGSAEHKLDAWISALVEEAAGRPWFPPIMLRELASGAAHIDAETFGMMNAVYTAIRDVFLQGQRENAFRKVDPLLTYLTIMPTILIFFARQRMVAAQKKNVQGLAAAAPREIDQFIRHMQESARALLRRQT